jgi:spore coat polysaccharide biosynthesis protein SpsF
MSQIRTVAIIQGRMAASRLPGKVLLDIAGQSMLARVVARARRAQTLDLVTVATTIDPSDDPVEVWCRAHETPIFRGDMFDVLDRFYQAARKLEADVIVRITADCPVIDPVLIDETVQALQPPIDFSCNRLPPPWARTYPIGLDVEVCTFAAFERAWKEADQKHQREHVMPFIYEGVQFASAASPVAYSTSTRGFRIAQLNHDPDYGSLRWTVDTPEDLVVMRHIFTHFGRDDFSWQDVLTLQQRQPEMFTINAGVVHRTAFDVDERRK